MADLNDIHMMVGRLLEGQENLERGVHGINTRLDQNIQPILDDYKSTKNKILGVCATISAIAGMVASYISSIFKNT